MKWTVYSIALCWLLLATITTRPVLAADEKGILQLFYDRANGKRWVNNTNWDTDEPICTWYGVTCESLDDNSQVVTEIALESNNLAGRVAKRIYELPHLQKLQLKNNALTEAGLDAWSESAAVAPLLLLDLADNSLTSMSGIDKVAQATLQELHLSSNLVDKFHGDQLSRLKNLKKAYLSFNIMKGMLPTTIGTMSKLERLYLYGNDLTGKIPSEIGKLNKLEVITLSENRITGTVPEQVNNLVNIKTFSIHNDEEKKTKLSGPLRSFDKSPHLEELYFTGNSLTGAIPDTFLQSSNNTNKLVTVFLSGNDLTGKIPSSLTKFSSLNIDITDNQITGIPDKICTSRRSWMLGQVENYGCDAVACKPGMYNSDGRQTADDNECQTCALQSSSPFYGSKKCESGPPALNEWEALAFMYKDLGGKQWVDNTGWSVLDSLLKNMDNLDSSLLQYCDSWFGVVCENGQVSEIDLSNNGLVGTIPSDVFALPALSTLLLSQNAIHLDDELQFKPLGKSSTLRILDLSGTKIKSLSHISQATSLRELVLDGNDLSSGIPSGLYDLTDLSRLHIRHSELAGALSTLMGKLTKLQYLNLSSNRFGGKVPSELGQLTALKKLELSENAFTGKLPGKLMDLTNLEEFHLTQTGPSTITGNLPAFNKMPNLAEISLSHNALTGSIPSNFIKGADTSALIKIHLAFNQLDGSIPVELEAFDELEIRLEGNKITSIPDALCSKKKWMNGEVEALDSCNAILCPDKTWNLYGKASSTLNARCAPCDGAQFYGSTACGADTNPNPEKAILDKLYDSTSGRDWNRAGNWTTPGVPICQREGITCDADANGDSGVSVIRLNEVGLSGSVPDEVFELPDLRLLGLTGNQVTLSFSKIAKATKLRILQLSTTKVRSMTGIGSAPASMTELHLANNQIEGAFPDEFFLLTGLKQLYMNGNQLTGKVPTEIAKLTNLELVYLASSSFSSHLPTELGLLTALKKIDLEGNSLSGNLPTELEALTALDSLFLGEQRSKKKIGGPLLPFSKNSKLVALDLNSNALTGKIPSNFLDQVATDVPVSVDLANNKIRGEVPTNLGRFDNLYIDLSNNRIEQLSGDLCTNSNAKWMDGKMGELGLTCNAILCPPGSFMAVYGRQVEASEECEPCPNGEQDAPNFGSVTCSSLQVERDILTKLYKKLDGKNWVDNTNWGTDQSVCEWHGVFCGDGADTNIVTELSLEDNGLVATEDVSELLFSLPQIKKIDIKGNPVIVDLTKIPEDTRLQSLKLSETGLQSIAGVSRAKELQRLHVTNNDLGGALNDELFDMTNLSALYLSFNSFSGSLPTRTGELTNLQEFYMYGNQITGALPGSAIAKLTKLKEFVMSSNYLSGDLPVEFSSLDKLEQLSLYEQQNSNLIGGTIPDFSGAPNLWYFDVSDNDMTGTIPQNFMENSLYKDDGDAGVFIYLSNNELKGGIPSSMDDFTTVDLRVVGNRITNVPNVLCDNAAWMKGNVGIINSCAAIACPPKTYSDSGRQEKVDEPCKSCVHLADSDLWGQRQCESFDSERAILGRIYSDAGGKNWSNSSGWDTDAPICGWKGVICQNGADDDEGVISLDLSANNVVGTLPSSAFTLPLLRSLNVKDNVELHVPLDKTSKADNLELLYLSNVRIDNIDGVSWPKKLKRLHLTGNGLTGSLPDIFGLGDTLEALFIAFNSFSGELSTRIGRLTALKELYAYDNDFSGTIPSQIGLMTSLSSVVLSENLLSGQLPSQLSSLPSLTLFSVFRRSKPGPRLTGSLPSFDKNPQLTDLYLDHNDIDSTIPETFLSSSKAANLVILSHNRIHGQVPEGLDNIPALNLQLEGNQISAYPPSFCDNNAWMDGALGDIGCRAFLCPPDSASPIGRANKTILCDDCQSSTAALYYGSLTCDEPRTERTILTRFYQQTGGSAWHRRDGWATDADICTWFGITCDKGNTGSVTSIKLGGNNLIGTPEPDLFDLPWLETLWLYSNPMDVSFENIGAASRLTDLRLDATRLSKFGGIKEAKSLTSLDLSFNQHKTTFPPDILLLTNLRYLNLGFNKFTKLPASFSDLAYLRTLRLGSNQIEGNLPSFDGMNSLTTIDLSQNSLAGSIPSNFLDRISSSAKVSVNLSSNKLVGSIPRELDRFETLTLYLRDNKIQNVPQALCDNNDWFGGDVENYGCDAIMCPPGSFNALGRRKDGHPCFGCGDNSPYFGQATCKKPTGTLASAAPSPAISAFVSATVLATVYFLMIQ